MLLLILSSAFAVLTRKAVLPRRMFVFHMPTWQMNSIRIISFFIQKYRFLRFL